MPSLNLDDTIAAIATPVGEGGIAVIRLSGKNAFFLAEQFFRSDKNGNLNKKPSHTIHHGFWMDENGNSIDEVLVSLFRNPHSYTGEDVVEVSCHGGMKLSRKILELLVRKGARHAEPGEFTKRAFLNGKMDLTQAEAILDLIKARSDASLEAAFRQLQGGLSKRIISLKEILMKIYAHMEAGLDFPDEHLESYSKEDLLSQIGKVKDEIKGLIASFQRGALLREGILTVILGRPNVGKSSLLNTILERDRALVSEFPGTTRDSLEEEVEIGGMRLQLVDTAGLGTISSHPLDRMSMEKTRSYLEKGNLFLFLVDGSEGWTSEDEKIFEEIQNKNFLIVINKIDLPQKMNLRNLSQKKGCEAPVSISCITGKGIQELEKRIEEKISQMNLFQDSFAVSRLRHKQAFETALESLECFERGIQGDTSSELTLVDLKSALDSLRELIGEIYSEDLLDIIFQEFCIGK